MAFASVPSVIAHLRSGKLRGLGVGAAERYALIPDVPTISESGLPGYAAANWIGIVAPATSRNASSSEIGSTSGV